MNYIINPWWFYLAGLFGKLEILWLVIIAAFPIFVCIGMLLLLLCDVDYDKFASIVKGKSKLVMAVLLTCALLFIAVPTQDTVNKMIIANVLTTEKHQRRRRIYARPNRANHRQNSRRNH